MKLKIIHVKKTNLARAPDELRNVQTIYGKYDYVLCIDSNNSKRRIEDELKKTDQDTKVILHYHNVYVDIPSIPKSMKVIHYHSEPQRIKKITDECGTKLVLNQYHCTLDFYKECDYIVPNTFDVNNITPKWEKPLFSPSHIKIVYIPSITNSVNKYFDKGYDKTVKILNQIKNKYKEKVNVVIKSNISYQDSIKEKVRAHIVIDECVTGSFHKTSIEGLSYGCLVFAFISDKLIQKHMEKYGKVIPVCNVPIEQLQNELGSWIERGKDEIEKEAIKRWEEFKEMWSPEKAVQEFDHIYEKICQQNNINLDELLTKLH